MAELVIMKVAAGVLTIGKFLTGNMETQTFYLHRSLGVGIVVGKGDKTRVMNEDEVRRVENAIKVLHMIGNTPDMKICEIDSAEDLKILERILSSLHNEKEVKEDFNKIREALNNADRRAMDFIDIDIETEKARGALNNAERRVINAIAIETEEVVKLLEDRNPFK